LPSNLAAPLGWNRGRVEDSGGAAARQKPRAAAVVNIRTDALDVGISQGAVEDGWCAGKR